MERDILESFVGEVVIGNRSGGGEFSGRLIAIQGDECWFESKSGVRWMVNRANLAGIRPVVRRQ